MAEPPMALHFCFEDYHLSHELVRKTCCRRVCNKLSSLIQERNKPRVQFIGRSNVDESCCRAKEKRGVTNGGRIHRIDVCPFRFYRELVDPGFHFHEHDGCLPSRISNENHLLYSSTDTSTDQKVIPPIPFRTSAFAKGAY
jgi:hypothetical protein